MARQRRGSRSNLATPSVPPPDDDAVERSLLEHSMRSTVHAAGQAFFLMIIIAAALVHLGGSARVLAGWGAAVTLNLVVYAVALRRVGRRLARGAAPRELRPAIVTVQLVAGTCWGVLGFLNSSGREAADGLILAAILMIASGNLIYAAATPGPFLAMHLPLCGLSAAGLALAGDYVLAAMICFTGMSAVPLRGELHRTILTAIQLSRHNLQLVEEVQAQGAELVRINRGLTAANLELAERATRDPLTLLPNRALLAEHLGSLIRPGEGGDRPVGIVYFDIDRFKLVNDTLGHGAGDDLLRQVAARVSGGLRDGDLLARLGGDEFVVVVANGRSAEALAVARRVHAAFGAPFAVGGVTRRFTASVGVASGAGCPADELIARADAALYRAKEAGRDRVEVWDGSFEALGVRGDRG